ncbi:MAG: MBL fold metallo-hydrolase [Candidatus Marinimicrobia bacterium]|nr:MBL fold metallo-hydrolase [Candidatus Neomarinimicrobiota bacterium]MCF7828492.1 MBL fold metallo-hydrolase [Candidatus Neomarinimicrobiota bacterium]MCF7881982.1 MBL fold metallo-hydrolase [Candidatus Neomarinimicrobiota bacterium]
MDSTVHSTSPAHHTENGFRNPYSTWEDHGFRDMLKWSFSDKPEIPETYTLPWVENNLSFLGENSSPSYTWIGHATFLIEIDGKTILTDPFFSDRASPVQWAGPKRMVPPALPLEDLPPIDFVVISHNHYDHLDYHTVKYLADRGSHFIVPLEMDKWFRGHGMPNVTALDWWQRFSNDGLTFHATPAQHFCARTPFDRNDVLWASWVIESTDHVCYFAGDTGYFPGFKEIANRFPAIDVALLPIGAYAPRWFMGPVHLDPSQAVQVFTDLGAEYAIAMHWGTIKLTDEAMDEPPILLKESLKSAGIPSERFPVFAHGETRRMMEEGWRILQGTEAQKTLRNFSLP